MQRVYGRSHWARLRFSTVIVLAAGVLLPARVEANGLRLDGKLIVKGMPMEGARVIVVSHDKEPEVLTGNLSHFTLTLDLHKDYLLSFERPGCMSKQLQFSTKLPTGAVVRVFDFPFQVTLEAALPGGHMEYAGPVGYIQYDGRLNDFGYNTDYRVQQDAVLSERLEKARGELRATSLSGGGNPVALASTAAPAVAGKPVPPVEARRSAPVAGKEQTAPSVRLTPPMVHVLDRTEPRNPARKAEEVQPAPVPPPEPSVVNDGPVDDGRSALGLASEVQVDPLHVTTIVTRVDGDRKVEYRRVASYYGSVTYFCNGRPCSAEVYYKGVKP